MVLSRRTAAPGRIETRCFIYHTGDVLWDARARSDDEGWTAELGISFTTLSFDPRNESWGVNVERVGRKDEKFRGTQARRVARDLNR